MFKKYIAENDTKKLLAKALDIKKDHPTRLKNFKYVMEHSETVDLLILFEKHSSIIYHTFIETFSSFDHNSKQRKEDLDCILYVLEKIIVHNPHLIRKRWQFYSITFVMQKLLHQHCTYIVRDEGIRLFLLWYQIIADETNLELQNIFSSLVPGLINLNNNNNLQINQDQYVVSNHLIHSNQNQPIKLCTAEPLVPIVPGEKLPNGSNEISYYLNRVIEFMITQTSKPIWKSYEESKQNHELGFEFLFKTFKKVYLTQLYANMIQNQPDLRSAFNAKPAVSLRFVDENNDKYQETKKDNALNNQRKSICQEIVIKWLTRVFRQERIPGQDELVKRNVGGADDKSKSRPTDQDFSFSSLAISVLDSASVEMEIARKVLGTKPDNIKTIHELFRQSFHNYNQPTSTRRILHVYKEIIFNTGSSQTSGPQSNHPKIGYISFSELLQTFIANSYSAFLIPHNHNNMSEQIEMCKRIMNIYRFMVMKIYMDAATWNQVINVMLSITNHLFSPDPPELEDREPTLVNRLAPSFFQTFIVSWIRANLYIYIPSQMWEQFHLSISKLVNWKPLIDEWGVLMNALTRVLVKNCYGLNLSDLPLNQLPLGRRGRPKASKSLSSSQGEKSVESKNFKDSVDGQKGSPIEQSSNKRSGLSNYSQEDVAKSGLLRRCNSDSFLILKTGMHSQGYQGIRNNDLISYHQSFSRRKIKSDYLNLATSFESRVRNRSMSQSTYGDTINPNVKDAQFVLEDGDQFDDQQQSSQDKNHENKKNDMNSTDKCILLKGNIKGWTPENSVIMWRRMLSIFGNINRIKIPENHLLAMKCLANILSDLIKTRENMGISLDNQSTPDPPKLVPPYTYIAPWVLEATHLPDEYSESRLLAYQMLCLMCIRKRDIELSSQLYACFYEALHRGLNSKDDKVKSAILQDCAPLLCMELPGSTILINDFVETCKHILNLVGSKVGKWSNSKDAAIVLLNSVLSLSRLLKSLACLKSEVEGFAVINYDPKLKICNIITDYSKTLFVEEGRLRGKALCSLTMFVYQELVEKMECSETDKLIDAIVTDFQANLNNDECFRINCELVDLLSDHAGLLANTKPELVTSLIQYLCQLLTRISGRPNLRKESILCLLIGLENWCIPISKQLLFKPINSNRRISIDDDQQIEGSTLISYIMRSLSSIFDSDSASSQPGLQLESQNMLRDKSNISNDDIYQSRTQNEHCDELVKLSCKFTYEKLLCYIGHFPWRQIGAASMSCCVDEFDYLTIKESDLSSLSDQLKKSNVCMLVVDGDTIVSFIDSPSSTEPAHVLVRNLCGKFAWDASCMQIHELKTAAKQEKKDGEILLFNTDSYSMDDHNGSNKMYDSDFTDDCEQSNSSVSSRSSGESQRDVLSMLSQILTKSSGQSKLGSIPKKRNLVQSISNPSLKISQAEETMIALLTNQRYQELNHFERVDDSPKLSIKYNLKNDENQDKDMAPASQDQLPIESGKVSRKLIQQLGLIAWEKRKKIESLNQSASFLRELRNLDAQSSRETHKIAVIYVGHGQEDKNSILCNSTGSRAFEDFVSALAWEVNLSSHLGFKGGLSSNKIAAETGLYYCNASTEVMFHVSTRIPVSNVTDDDELLNRKLKHLGNDEVHIIWSEHSRDFRRGIIPTEFSDIIIAIYPMISMFQGYYRVQIDCKSDVPIFGPLFDSCVVHQSSLAALVRATAINASRARRLKLAHYQTHFEQRNKLIESICRNHKEDLTFEEFAANLYLAT